MSQASEARTSTLDRVLDGATLDTSVAEELFAAVDTIDAVPALRRTLSDPGSDPEARASLVRAVFDGKVSATVVEVLAAGVSQRWPSAASLVAALERQAVRAELTLAESDGGLDAVEDELFRFGRTVEGDSALAGALADRSVPVAVRQGLVEDLLAGKVGAPTLRLAKRAVNARERTFAHTIDSYVALAAAQRNRVVATVRAARPLTGEQRNRLTAALTRQVARAIDVQVIVDPEVLGGVRVELGDQVIEGTVAHRLDEARRSLTE